MGLRPLTLVTLAALALTPRGAHGQEAVRSIALVVDLSAADGSAEVRADYELSVASEEPVVVPFELLGFGAATASGFELDGQPRSVPLEPASGSRRRAEVVLPVPGEVPLRLTARYRVEEAVGRAGGGLEVTVPVLVVAWPPEEALPGHFTAELRLPSAWRVVEGFPSGIREAAGSGAATTHVVDLSVAPSLVSLRARDDGAWRPGLPFVLDAVVLLLVAGFGAAGWVHLRGVAARAHAGPEVEG